MKTKRFNSYGQSSFNENIRFIKIELYFISYSSSKVGNVSEVEKITFELLWNGKDRIKRNVMCQDYKNGGIRMTN